MTKEGRGGGVDQNVLLINTERGVQTGASGYARLADALGGVELATARRSDPKRLFERSLTGFAGIWAANTWYRLGSLQAEWRAWRMIKRQVPEVVHILWGDQDWGYIDLLLPDSTALVITVHNPPDLLPQNFRRLSALKRADRIILMSPDQGRYFEAHGVTTERCCFVPHGIDVHAFNPGNRRDRNDVQPLRVLHVGNYLRNFDHLAEVIRILEGENFQFEIVCSHGNRSAQKFGSQVNWHHGISDSDLLNLYQTCDVLLMTATGATANNAILEGLACGMPVVFQEVGGLGAYLEGDCSIGVEATGPEFLVAALERLEMDRSRVRVMGEKARAKAEKFSWEKIARQTREIYAQAYISRIGGRVK